MRLETVKNYLDITWDDSDTDAKLTGIISRAEATLESYAGVELDFSEEGTPEAQLLLDLCRYIWWDCFEDFKTNYRSELIMLRANAMTAADDTEEEDYDLDEQAGGEAEP